MTLNQLLDQLKGLTGRSDLQADYQPPRKGDVRDSLADITSSPSVPGVYSSRGSADGSEADDGLVEE